MKKYLISYYKKKAFTANLVLGYEVEGIVYASTIKDDNHSILDDITSVEKSNGTAILRFRATKSKIRIIEQQAEKTFVLCSIDYLKEYVKLNGGNKGTAFENLIAQRLGAIQTKNCLPFWQGGDIVLKDGTHFQVKYDKGNFINEHTIQVQEAKLQMEELIHSMTKQK